MAFSLGGNKLPSPTQRMESNPITGVKGVGVHQRAYASIEISDYKSLVKNGSNCKCDITKIESQVTGSFSQMFSVEGGASSKGRLAPKPSLDSITVSNDGGQDMSDAMLFQADITLKVYSKDDFDDIDVAFMTPRRKVKITIGYVGGNKPYVLQAEITGFNFTINSDLSYDVSLKAAGATDGLIEVDYTTLRKDGPTPITYEDPEGDKEIESTDVITNFLALMAKTTSDLKRGTFPWLDAGGDMSDGSSTYDTSTEILAINHQMSEGFDLTIFGRGLDRNDNIVSYVSLQRLIDDLNLNAGTVEGIPEVLFDTSQLTLPTQTKEFASASPTEMIFGWNAVYGDTDYTSNIPNTTELSARSIWIGQPLLQSIFDQLKKPPGKEDAPKRVSTATFFKQIFNAISANSGGFINLFLYADPSLTISSSVGSGQKAGSGFFLILNKGTAATKSSMTTINLADGFEKGIRDCSLTSNLDSELISMATAAAMDGEGGAHLNTLFSDCYPESQTDDDTDKGKSKDELKQSMEDAFEALGDKINDSEVSQCKQAMKAYVKKIQKKTNPIIPYGLECELTCDGYGGPKYGDAFKVDRLPKRLKNNAYFVVTKIGQNFSGGDWTTTISGLMMIKAD